MASVNVVTTTRTSPDTMVTINSQTFILTPAAAVSALVNTALTLSDTVFPGNLSNYNTDASSFSPSINVALAAFCPTSTNGATENMASMPLPISLHNKCAYNTYVTMNGPSHASVNWRTNSTSNNASGITIQPVTYMAKHAPISHMGTIPFIIDSGANCYIQCLKKLIKCFVLFDCLRDISRTRKGEGM